MAFSSGNGSHDGGRFSADTPPMSEINVTPMVDVMLVLLIIFMITAPLVTHKIAIDLPQAAATKNPDKPDIVTLSLDAQGKLFWNDQEVTVDEWKVRVRSAALKTPQPELHLRAEKTTQYQRLAEIMADAQAAGLVKIGFVTNPKSTGAAATR
ncbi:MAG TPA: biopolymer transporter ExbD [Verrucomicrobiae bacterium]|nr:biopolymer transporter ExbD [Verrucomicrobiae bacterium]